MSTDYTIYNSKDTIKKQIWGIYDVDLSEVQEVGNRIPRILKSNYR
jgi:hypothetical protein